MRLWYRRSGPEGTATCPKPAACWGRRPTWPPSRPGARPTRSTAGPTSSRWARSSARSSPGSPAFGGDSSLEILRAAGRADTAAATERLARCEADDELIALARDCLAAEPKNRPADAGVVAERLTGYLAGVQERLRSAELARAAEAARAQEASKTAEAAEAKAAAERRAAADPGPRRDASCWRADWASPAGGGSSWIEWAGPARQRGVSTLAVREATRLRGQAQGAAMGDLAPWDAAAAAVEKARALLVAGVEPGVRKQVDELAAEVAADRGLAVAAAEAATRDRRLLDRLTDIRSARADDRLGDNTDAAYREAFREADIDPDVLTAEEAGRRIKARPAEIATALAMTLDDWAAVRRDLLKDAARQPGWPWPPDRPIPTRGETSSATPSRSPTAPLAAPA